MNRETFAVSQKELQRVAVVAACLKGEMACARAAELLSLSVRQIKRLKKRLREAGEAALAHANRGRPSHTDCPSAPAKPSCAWPAPSTSASTTTIWPKNSARSKDSRSVA